MFYHASSLKILLWTNLPVLHWYLIVRYLCIPSQGSFSSPTQLWDWTWNLQNLFPSHFSEALWRDHVWLSTQWLALFLLLLVPNSRDPSSFGPLFGIAASFSECLSFSLTQMLSESRPNHASWISRTLSSPSHVILAFSVLHIIFCSKSKKIEIYHYCHRLK